jgi:acylpyruvate hydrolase
VIATGTPAGVGFGMEPQRWLRDGDLVEVLVGDLPPLRNRVVR